MAAAHPALSSPVSERPPAARAPRDASARYAGIAVTILVHVVLIAALLQYAPVRRALATAKPIMVSIIPLAQPLPDPPPKAKPALPPRMARTEAPTPVERVPEPRPVIAESPAVSPVTIQVAEPPPAPVAQAAVAPEPPPIIPPRFNADYLQNPAPAYPPLARRMHEQGKVLIRVLVSVDGRPERIELKASSGHARLDQSALETIRGWKFVPARQGSETVAAWVVVPITFSLDG
jgi:protein TonB